MIGAIDGSQFHAPSVRDRERQDVVRNRHRHNRIAENAPQLTGLGYEVQQIHDKKEEYLYMLPGTGFQIKTQIDLFIENYKKGVPLAESFQQIEQDVQAFKVEYLVEQPVFPIVLEKRKYKGKDSIVGKLYGGKSIVEATDERERDGVVKKSVSEIQKYLLSADPGSMAVMTSPKGWSGYDGITYPDTQTYCYQVQQDGSIRGFTLKTDMTLAQNEELLKKLGVDEKVFEEGKDQKTGIKRVVENVAFISSDKGKSIEDVAQIIKQTKGSEVAYVDSLKQSRTFTEMITLLKNPDSLWTLDSTVQNLVDSWKEYAGGRIKSLDELKEQDLSISLGLIVMKLMNEIRPPVKKNKMEIGVAYPVVQGQILFDPREILSEMKELAGCAGGGGGSIGRGGRGIIDSAGIARAIKFYEGDKKILCCTCPFCKTKVEAVIEGGRISCPNPECGKSAPYEEQTTGE